MKKSNLIIAKLMFWFAILILAFSNCAPAENGFDSSSFGSSCVGCTGDQNPDIGQVAIRVNAADPLVIFKGDIGMNVGGICDVGNFPNNNITWTLKETSGANIASSVSIIRCDGVRFSFLVDFPPGINYDTAHTLDITMNVSDINGAPSAQPALTSIGVLAIDPPE